DWTRPEYEGQFRIDLLRSDLEVPEPVNKLDREVVIKEQRDDENLGPIYRVLSGEAESPTVEQIDYAERHFELDGGKLFQKVRRNTESWLKLAIPDTLIIPVLHAAHDIPTSGHFDARRTLAKIANYVFWRGMAKDVDAYVKSCRECQFRKMEAKKPHSFQSSVGPVPQNIFETISADLIGPIP